MKRRLKKQLPALLGLGSVLMAAMGGMGYMGFKAASQATADALGCYADAPQRQTFVFVDASGPRFNDEQRRSLQSYFDQLYAGLAFNELVRNADTGIDKDHARQFADRLVVAVNKNSPICKKNVRRPGSEFT